MGNCGLRGGVGDEVFCYGRRSGKELGGIEESPSCMVLKGDSCHNVSFLPEAVQVAVGAGPDNLLAGHEDSEGL